MKRWGVVGLTVLAAAACGVEPAPIARDRAAERERDASPAVVAAGALFGSDGLIEAVGGRLDGSVGPATGLASTAEAVSFFDDGFYTQSNLTVRGNGASAMGIFSINGSVRDLDNGETVRTCQDDWSDPESAVSTGGISASFTGCANAGSPEDGWSYDAPAACTDVRVEAPTEQAPDDAVATLTVLAHWDATFDYNGGEIPAQTVKATLHLTQR